jgi:hypothetical protein
MQLPTLIKLLIEKKVDEFCKKMVPPYVLGE